MKSDRTLDIVIWVTVVITIVLTVWIAITDGKYNKSCPCFDESEENIK